MPLYTVLTASVRHLTTVLNRLVVPRYSILTPYVHQFVADSKCLVTSSLHKLYTVFTLVRRLVVPLYTIITILHRLFHAILHGLIVPLYIIFTPSLHQFFTDSWCLFDLFIVSMSLISLGPIDLPAR